MRKDQTNEGDRNMKKRIVMLLVLAALVLALGASLPAWADSPRTIVGRTGEHAPFAGGMDIFISFDVREIDPKTFEAAGPVSWSIYHPWSEQFPFGGWRQVEAQAVCVRFGEDVEGQDPRTAILVSRITRKAGWGQGEPGEYAYWWLLDSPEGDQSAINYYRRDDPDTEENEMYEFFPQGSPPGCEYFETSGARELQVGDLTIGRMPELLPATGVARQPDYGLFVLLGGSATLAGLGLALLRHRSRQQTSL
jgi:hypothetical protein